MPLSVEFRVVHARIDCKPYSMQLNLFNFLDVFLFMLLYACGCCGFCFEILSSGAHFN